ncbi:alpha/beta fold hydrolase [Chitinophaga tropicalis]|uniref:Alpha/beta fold hydrolase n=1 Tax=Chitinophaga tropicalis TaxID=2683588 RepID=A0A7K1U0J7_9BACT|nr:alpha/beta hydrolase [Chitinophaga tropicalis]MVT07882.1 alpha/beta fold hydrolase [Chitinophaga tropicalis]
MTERIITIGQVPVTCYEGGQGDNTLVLLHGWPQTSYVWRKVFQPLAEQHRVIAIDLPGMGNDNAADSADTAAIAAIVKCVCDELGLDKFNIAGHDIGAWVAAAFALAYEERLRSLIVMDAGIPGLIPDEIFTPANAGKIWQFYFHAIKELPEQLLEGKEREYLSWYFENKSAVKDAITAADIDHYVQAYKGKRRLTGGFAYYQAFPESVIQNKARLRNLSIPVLAIGGEKAQGLNMGKAMSRICTENLTAISIPDCGHYIPEERPEEMLRAFDEFFIKVK